MSTAGSDAGRRVCRPPIVRRPVKYQTSFRPVRVVVFRIEQFHYALEAEAGAIANRSNLFPDPRWTVRPQQKSKGKCDRLPVVWITDEGFASNSAQR
jgi:hypothetical protein